MLLDRLLAEAGIPPRCGVRGRGGLASGSGHVRRLRPGRCRPRGTGGAEPLDLHFVPVAWEDFDIVLSGDVLAAAEPLIAAVRDPDVQSSVYALGGYDLSRAGAVELLT